MRHLIFGDCHSSGIELEELIHQFCPQDGDVIISVGDLFDRGIHGNTVWKLIKHFKIKSVLGNHERKMLQYLKGERKTVPKHYSWFLDNFIDKKCSKEQFIEYLESLPLIIKINDDTLVTHAACVLEDPFKEDISANVYGFFDPTKRMPTPWLDTTKSYFWDKYDGDPLVLYGHLTCKNNEPRIRKNSKGKVNSIGLDTSACHGGMLTGYVLEEDRFIQVKSFDNWYGKLKQKIANEK
jgi:hypothetical protein